MRDTLKNYWRPFAAWVIRSKNKILGRSGRKLIENTETRFFLVFTLGLFSVYTLVDLVTNPHLEALGYDFFTHYTFGEKLDLLGTYSLENLKNAGAPIKLLAALLITFCAYALTSIAVEPLSLVRKKQKYFAANVSHELRTPLSVLKTTAEVARMYRDMLTPEQLTDLTKSINEEVDRMANIIEFFIHFAAFENNLELEMSPLDISNVLKKAKNLLATQATLAGVNIELALTSPVAVYGNFTALEEMTVNLTKNAIANSPRGSTVTLAARNEGSRALMIITDEGQGISEADLPHIFEVFYKGSNSPRGGSGLGLTVVRQIAKMHDATIEVMSGAGKGSTFIVSFPK